MTWNHLDLFSGIGGAALAVDAVWPDAEHLFCEVDPFCRAVLKKHWPGAETHDDIRTLNGYAIRSRVDLVTGGFPCQPYSVAGRREGAGDQRALWPEMSRVIREVRPRWVVGENVRGLVAWNGGLAFEQVHSDLETLGYEVLSFLLPACAVDAPHRRERVWIVACRAPDFSERKDRGRRPGAWRNAGRAREGIRTADLWGDPGALAGRGNRRTKRTAGGGMCMDELPPLVERAGAADLSRNAVGERRGGWRSGLEDCGDPGTRSEGEAPRPDPALPFRTDVQRCGERDRLFAIDSAARAPASWQEHWLSAATRLCPLDDGLSRGLVRLPDGSRISRARWRREALKGAGNAWVPQVAIAIFRAIRAYANAPQPARSFFDE